MEVTYEKAAIRTGPVSGPPPRRRGQGVARVEVSDRLRISKEFFTADTTVGCLFSAYSKFSKRNVLNAL